MDDIAIRVENLSKRYRIGLEEKRNDTLVGAMTSFLSQPMQNIRRLRRLTTFSDNGDGASHHDNPDIIWALRDVSFEVSQGEVVGIIGRNGAGKSTLLKILSRITHPTSGRATLNGRVSCLLEVGTGFHPELTGRENIYLNGTILGMTRVEIDRKFDEILEFSGVEKFIDTPVKRYSSGMQVRLAFSVAAHLEPEILLVDEVLAVWDAAFQKKSIGKMQDVSKSGRTVFFVSHNLAAVSALCSSAFLLEEGQLTIQGDVEDIIAKYIRSDTGNKPNQSINQSNRSGNGALQFTAIQFQTEEGVPLETVSSGDNLVISLSYKMFSENVLNVNFGVNVYGFLGQQMFQCKASLVDSEYATLPPHGEVKCAISKLPLPPGDYNLMVWAKSSRDFLDKVENVATLTVQDGDFFGSGKLPYGGFRGVLVPHVWHPVVERSDNG